MVQLGYLAHRIDPRRFPEPDDVFQLRISLVGIKPAIWRRLLVPKSVALPQLHAIIQIAMGWTDSHLHQFRVGDILFAEPSDEDELPGPIDYRRITLGQVPRGAAQPVSTSTTSATTGSTASRSSRSSRRRLSAS